MQRELTLSKAYTTACSWESPKLPLPPKPAPSLLSCPISSYSSTMWICFLLLVVFPRSDQSSKFMQKLTNCIQYSNNLITSILFYSHQQSKLAINFMVTNIVWEKVKTTQKRAGRGYSLRDCSGKGVSHHCLHWGETQKQAGWYKSFRVKKKERLQLCSKWRLSACATWWYTSRHAM